MQPRRVAESKPKLKLKQQQQGGLEPELRRLRAGLDEWVDGRDKCALFLWTGLFLLEGLCNLDRGQQATAPPLAWQRERLALLVKWFDDATFSQLIRRQKLPKHQGVRSIHTPFLLISQPFTFVNFLALVNCLIGCPRLLCVAVLRQRQFLAALRELQERQGGSCEELCSLIPRLPATQGNETVTVSLSFAQLRAARNIAHAFDAVLVLRQQSQQCWEQGMGLLVLEDAKGKPAAAGSRSFPTAQAASFETVLQLAERLLQPYQKLLRRNGERTPMP